ncbi:unnamed protein product [Brachionus calyciflorus]|uniref:receptor protein-tyrosine kinase n=1 Tax=Brachionus calyciflorus TaxID=104777 RepID=A0A813YL85_9BILA|nr:unnamed protein product [Brachionus calyciflorus]
MHFALVILILLEILIQKTDARFTVCSSINIQGPISVNKLSKVQNCSIVVGHIRLMNTQFHDLNQSTSIFPNLIEITDYLLIFQIQNINNLEILFPKLSIIRGHNLFKNNALIIFLTNSLLKLSLKSLVQINKGSVLISRLYHACYINTIDWSYILKNNTKPIINLNNNECFSNCFNCWSENSVQLKCPTKCENNCNLKNTSQCCPDSLCSYCQNSTCLSCSNFRDLTNKNGKCVLNCAENSLIYENSLCIKLEDCSIETKSLVKNYNIIENRACVKECPVGYKLEYKVKKINEKLIKFRECVRCDDQICKKDCSISSFHLRKNSDLDKVKNCHKVKSLIIELEVDLGSSFLAEYLKYLEEIEDFLIITRNSYLTSLKFLKRLRKIHGKSLFENKYSIFVHTNPKLRDLWPEIENKKFQISYGSVKFFENPDLCFQIIENFLLNSNLSNIHESDVSFNFNGYRRLTCSNRTIELKFELKRNFIKVLWNVTISDLRRLKGFNIFYKQVAENYLEYDISDSFDQSDWMHLYVEFNEKNSKDFVSIEIENLEAFTKYAIYVKADLMINSNWLINSKYSTQFDRIISAINYVQTLPSQPGKIEKIEHEPLTSDKIILKWKPPKKPNGIIEFYFIAYTILEETGSFKFGTDNCDLDPNVIMTKKLENQEEKKSEQVDNKVDHKNTKCDTITNSEPKKSQIEIEQDEIISIEDEIYNLAFRPSKNFDTLPKYKTKIKQNNSIFQSSNLIVTSTKPIVETDQKIDELIKENFNLEEKLLFMVKKDLFVFENTNLLTTLKTNNQSLNTTLNGLKSFARYMVSIIGCQNFSNDLKNSLKQTKSLDNVKYFSIEQYCSKSSIYTFRSLPNESFDRIPEVYLYSEKSIYYFKWSKPVRPNGFIFKYNLKFIDAKSNKTYGPICHSSLDNLKVGLNQFLLTEGRLYLISVQAVSTAGYGPWSTQIVKYKVPSLSEYYLILTVQVIAVVFGALLLFVVLLLVFKKYNKSKEKGYFSIKSHYYYFRPDEWEIKRENLIIGERIGSGCFAEVHKGQLLDVKTNQKVDCAIKFCGSDHQSRQRLLKEANMMKSINATHIVRLLGVISRENPAYLILEYMDNGDLKEYLKTFRSNENKSEISTERFYRIAAEIADGMLWLSEHKYIHRDLAARNCLISKDNVIKIADLGLSKDIYQNPVYREKCKSLLPIRWMSPESLLDGSSTTKSDVWSYGVVIWEMVTYGENPYSGKDNEDVIRFVKNGGRLQLPDNAPFKLYSIFSKCMITEDFKRINFKDILDILDPDLTSDFKQASYYHTDFRKKPSKRKHSECKQINEDRKIEVVIAEPCADGIDNYM